MKKGLTLADVSVPQPAATLLLVRQGAAMEVLMVKRHHEVDFASGALVFPGGKVHADDLDPAWAGLVDEPDGLDLDARALRIAALREAFEESGVLLARQGRGGPFAPPGALESLHARRAAIAAGEASFRAAVAEAGLILALDALARFAHWITPEGVGRRYDTHFFIAPAPDDQVAACDGSETVEAVWLEPNAALEDGRAGKWQIVFPTRLNVEKLAESPHVDHAMEAARTRTIVTVTPRIVSENGARVLIIPAEAGYSVTREAFVSLQRAP
jgi:8-oxo-dGTP pyrophosphatase MutT (NUDIX family)